MVRYKVSLLMEMVKCGIIRLSGKTARIHAFTSSVTKRLVCPREFYIESLTNIDDEKIYHMDRSLFKGNFSAIQEICL